MTVTCTQCARTFTFKARLRKDSVRRSQSFACSRECLQKVRARYLLNGWVYIETTQSTRKNFNANDTRVVLHWLVRTLFYRGAEQAVVYLCVANNA